MGPQGSSLAPATGDKKFQKKKMPSQYCDFEIKKKFPRQIFPVNIKQKDLKLGTRRGPLLAPPPGDKKLGRSKKGHRSSVILKPKK